MLVRAKRLPVCQFGIAVGPVRRTLPAGAVHEHVVRTSPVGNTIEQPIELDARLIRA